MSAVDRSTTPAVMEMKSYFAAQRLCLRGDPPCVSRPCQRHHDEAATALGSVPCELCGGVGLLPVVSVVGHHWRVADNAEPCPDCDGYGRIWPSGPAPASTPVPVGLVVADTGVDGAAGRRALSATRPGPVPPSGAAGGSTS